MHANLLWDCLGSVCDFCMCTQFTSALAIFMVVPYGVVSEAAAAGREGTYRVAFPAQWSDKVNIQEVTLGLQVTCLPTVQMELQAGEQALQLDNTLPWRCFPQAETLDVEAWLRKRHHQLGCWRRCRCMFIGRLVVPD